MKTLDTTHVGQIYYIDKIFGANQSKLREMGFITDKKVTLVSSDGENAIVKIDHSRIALSAQFLKQIFVKNERSAEQVVGLSTLQVGQTGIVRLVDAAGEIKRRLMDMGITRGTSIYVQKLAPLGDPIELHLRGYALSLRKMDAEKIKVVLEQPY
ncbi:ferrous iron transport protein A [Lactococcus protaetiae]|uniref:Ferrous iron transport protein A n=1 Tax=Lactococcus protaetiae TaxID=2592653 RepID=A0A514Z7H4_9LACT|nr:ferrous iron transport protein A [Lactococcus protaetiae]MCL2112373.1 ferrous iron transport protein A [Streptococcaceae bacterium]QDK70447.1 ferrous iron transport protein A [Lactococcus protaetiae]